RSIFVESTNGGGFFRLHCQANVNVRWSEMFVNPRRTVRFLSKDSKETVAMSKRFGVPILQSYCRNDLCGRQSRKRDRSHDKDGRCITPLPPQPADSSMAHGGQIDLSNNLSHPDWSIPEAGRPIAATAVSASLPSATVSKRRSLCCVRRFESKTRV